MGKVYWQTYQGAIEFRQPKGDIEFRQPKGDEAMGWRDLFKSKKQREREDAEKVRNIISAYEFGRKYIQGATEEIDHLFRTRVNDVAKNHVKIFIDEMAKVHHGTKVDSRLVVDEYAMSIQELYGRMSNEVLDSLGEWRDIARQLGEGEEERLAFLICDRMDRVSEALSKIIHSQVIYAALRQTGRVTDEDDVARRYELLDALQVELDQNPGLNADMVYANPALIILP